MAEPELQSQSKEPRSSDAEVAELLTVCICTMRRPEELRSGLAALLACNPRPGQILVSDDSPADDRRSEEVCQECDGVEYAIGPRNGLAANRNSALRRVRADWVHFIDDDVIVPTDFYGVAAEAIAELDGMNAVISGFEYNHAEQARDDGPKLVQPPYVGFWCHMHAAAPGQANCVVINAAIFPTELFRRRRFDEVLKYGYEESDITLAAIAEGYLLTIDQRLKVDHYPSTVNRDRYVRQATVSAVYAGLKRQATHRRKPLRALGFALCAVPRLVASIARKQGIGRVPIAIWDVAQGFALFASQQPLPHGGVLETGARTP